MNYIVSWARKSTSILQNRFNLYSGIISNYPVKSLLGKRTSLHYLTLSLQLKSQSIARYVSLSSKVGESGSRFPHILWRYLITTEGCEQHIFRVWIQVGVVRANKTNQYDPRWK